MTFPPSSSSVSPCLRGELSLAGKLILLARDIKVSHTLFAMPFALLSMVLAGQRSGGLHVGQIGLIVLCMVTTRTVAMAANRLIDARLDAANPRTARRAIPAGRLSRAFVAAALILCAGGFVAATALFWFIYHNHWPLIFSGPVLLYLAGYPFLKRFTALCHWYLGAALGLAPVGAWVAIAGGIDWPPVVMLGAVLLWTAGFDIIYACQDYESDLTTGTFSVPARLGIGPALWVARMTHAMSAGLLVLLGVLTPELHALYFTGAGAAVALLIVEHSLVRGGDLSRVGLAFFTINGIISLLLGTLGIADVLL